MRDNIIEKNFHKEFIKLYKKYMVISFIFDTTKEIFDETITYKKNCMDKYSMLFGDFEIHCDIYQPEGIRRYYHVIIHTQLSDNNYAELIIYDDGFNQNHVNIKDRDMNEKIKLYFDRIIKGIENISNHVTVDMKNLMEMIENDLRS